MTVTISGTTGIDKVQDGTIVQADLAANVAGTGPAFSIYLTTNISISGVSPEKMVLSSNAFVPVGGGLSSSTFTPTVAGYYHFDAGCYASGSSMVWSQVQIRKNGTIVKSGGAGSLDTSFSQANVGALVFLNGTTDYVEFWARVSGTSPILQAGEGNCFATGFLARAA
jgi:hypothetical protein